ncbi:unnamed protein product [Lasius platythorax]|uniref:Uncharacterized protein n=1 Tax=Lasius platythorax TaxID=488582 RepID=A0AAV2NP31_9HYME
MAAAWVVLIVADEERRKLQLIRKNLRDLSNPFSIQESQFRLLYRLSKDAVRELCVQLRPYIEQEVRATAIPFELKILATLSFMASSSYQRRIGQDFLSCICANPL